MEVLEKVFVCLQIVYCQIGEVYTSFCFVLVVYS